VADVHEPTVCDIVVDGARVSNVNQSQLETVRMPPFRWVPISMLCFAHTRKPIMRDAYIACTCGAARCMHTH